MKTNKRILQFISAVLLAGFIVGCGKSEPYGDVVSTTDDFTASYESFETDLGAAANAEQAAKALNQFADSLEKLVPKMQALKEKYPELGEKKEELPENVQAAMDRMEAAMSGMGASMMKSAKYMMSPEFQEAQQHLMEVFEKMGDLED